MLGTKNWCLWETPCGAQLDIQWDVSLYIHRVLFDSAYSTGNTGMVHGVNFIKASSKPIIMHWILVDVFKREHNFRTQYDVHTHTHTKRALKAS